MSGGLFVVTLQSDIESTTLGEVPGIGKQSLLYGTAFHLFGIPGVEDRIPETGRGSDITKRKG